MGEKIEAAKEIIGVVGELASSKRLRAAVLGTYADGTPRSLVDSIDGEILSPKQRKEYLYNDTIEAPKKDKKKKKKKNKKKKYKVRW